MKKKQFKKLIKSLPETIDEINEVLSDEEIMMIDFMDGEIVGSIEEVEEGVYQMNDRFGCEITKVDIDHLLRNDLKK